MCQLYAYLGLRSTFLTKAVSKCMIIVDCSDYGPVAPYVATDTELSAYLDYAQYLVSRHDESWLDTWQDHWSQALAWDSIMEDSVGEGWYGRCLLLQAVAGLRGQRTPTVTVISR